MALVNAPLCSRCHEHHTKHSSGICSRCRRLKHSVPCRNCGNISTDYPSGICARCRSRGGGLQNLDDAIDHCETTLRALQLLKKNVSFQNIADSLGMSKSGVYSMCRSALHGPFYTGDEEVAG